MVLWPPQPAEGGEFRRNYPAYAGRSTTLFRGAKGDIERGSCYVGAGVKSICGEARKAGRGLASGVPSPPAPLRPLLLMRGEGSMRGGHYCFQISYPSAITAFSVSDAVWRS